MSTERLIFFLQIITGSTLILGVLLLLLSLFYFRRSRREAFWRFRRQAGQRGFRYSVMAGFLLVVSGAFCMVTAAVMFVEGDGSTVETASTPIADQSMPSATFTIEITLGATEEIGAAQGTENVDIPTVTVTAPFSPTPEPTTPIPVQTQITEAPLPFPSVTLDPLLALTPTQAAAPTEIAQVGSSRLQIRAMDDQISDEYEPIQPAIVFTEESRRFYFFMDYQGISSGETWSQTLLKDGEILQQQTQPWGLLPPEGRIFFFFGSSEGFAPGNYEVQIRVGEELTTYGFIVE